MVAWASVNETLALSVSTEKKDLGEKFCKEVLTNFAPMYMHTHKPHVVLPVLLELTTN